MTRHLRTYRLVFATAIFATAIALTGIGRADSSEQFELREATIADIQAAYRDGILSPQHLVSMYLARIAALDRSDLPQPLDGGVGNQPLNSFMHVNENALADAGRSEEHTSELQSRLHLVCRLLLEKKNKFQSAPFAFCSIITAVCC